MQINDEEKEEKVKNGINYSLEAENDGIFSSKENFFSFLFEVIKITIISFAIVLPIRWYLIQPFSVKGSSMEPNFYDNDYLIVNEIGYKLTDPKRGDVIIFKYPRNTKEYFIKRVIGLPGERVVIKDNHIFIFNKKHPNGLKLKEPYLDPNEINPREVDITLKSDEFFVLGDNRSHSMDSSIFGPVNRKLIIGKVWIRGFPFNRMGIIKTYQYE